MKAAAVVPRVASVSAAGIAALAYFGALLLLVGTTVMPVASAAGDEHDRERAHDEHGQGHPNGGRRERDNEIRQRDERRRYEQQHYWRYQRPVYVPPPVYDYPPQASPGINLVLPLEIRIR